MTKDLKYLTLDFIKDHINLTSYSLYLMLSLYLEYFNQLIHTYLWYKITTRNLMTMLLRTICKSLVKIYDELRFEMSYTWFHKDHINLTSYCSYFILSLYLGYFNQLIHTKEWPTCFRSCKNHISLYFNSILLNLNTLKLLILQ